MATANTHHQLSTILHILTQPFIAFGNLIVRLGENSSHAKEVARLNELSDAELAARGTSRREMTEYIFRAHTHI